MFNFNNRGHIEIGHALAASQGRKQLETAHLADSDSSYAPSYAQTRKELAKTCKTRRVTSTHRPSAQVLTKPTRLTFIPACSGHYQLISWHGDRTLLDDANLSGGGSRCNTPPVPDCQWQCGGLSLPRRACTCATYKSLTPQRLDSS